MIYQYRWGESRNVFFQLSFNIIRRKQNPLSGYLKRQKERFQWINIDFNQFYHMIKKLNLNIAPLNMVGEGLTDLENKGNSADACFSTSESTHSKITNTPFSNIEIATHRRASETLQPASLQNSSEQSQDVTQFIKQTNRLFTFMDEKEGERKQINKMMLQDQSNERQKFNKRDGFLEERTKQIHSLKMKDKVCNKWVRPNFQLKIDKSLSKLSQMSKSKTPKHFLSPYHKNCMVGQKNESKTPKFERKSNITPIHEKQLKIFRAKSILEKDFKKCMNVPLIQKYVLQQKQNCDEINTTQSARALMKKKKQLQKQLIAINGSLLNFKKKANATTKIKSTHLTKPIPKQSKKSTVKCCKLT